MGSHDLRTRIAALVTSSALLLALTAGAPASGAGADVETRPPPAAAPRVPSPSQILAALGRALDSPGVTAEISRLSTDLLRLPRTAFTEAQWLARIRIYQLYAARIVRAKAFAMDVSLFSPGRALTYDTQGTAAAVTRNAGSLNPRFVADLRAVTREAATSVACGTILDALAPDEKPFWPGKAEDAQQAASQAFTKLASRWSAAWLRSFVDWAYFVEGIQEDADQFVSSANATVLFRLPYVAGRPPASRALWVYLRTCYSPPHLPG